MPTPPAAQVLGEDADGSYSPLSLYYALALAATGAAGETQTQMLDLLGISDPAQLSDQCAKLYRLLIRDNEVGTLRLATPSGWTSGWTGNSPS